MSMHLTRRKRANAGWFVALLYLFCVLAPGVAPAFGSTAPWLPNEIKRMAVTHMHEDSRGGLHEHAGHHSDAGHAKHTHDSKTSPGPCCAMLCLSAIAADLPAVAKPVQPISVCVSENFQRLPGKAPPLLYRPPIV
ncbi:MULTISPECIES: hypothetical protein [unclassified Bradyrhizobium]|uniref:hypothetical protein n=1 Tax=unclassified Bradyrhizobium TaxID=2631580 RepID=UPI001FFB0742|nr:MULTISPECIES: hypothetical protein [unclassified Bradyrhizobium]